MKVFFKPIIFIVGFISGIGFAVYKLGAGGGQQTAVTSQQADPKAKELAEAIINLEARVTASPEDFQSWVQLGHLYFD